MVWAKADTADIPSPVGKGLWFRHRTAALLIPESAPPADGTERQAGLSSRRRSKAHASGARFHLGLHISGDRRPLWACRCPLAIASTNSTGRAYRHHNLAPGLLASWRHEATVLNRRRSSPLLLTRPGMTPGARACAAPLRRAGEHAGRQQGQLFRRRHPDMMRRTRRGRQGLHCYSCPTRSASRRNRGPDDRRTRSRTHLHHS